MSVTDNKWICDKCGKEKTMDEIGYIRSRENEGEDPFTDLEVVCSECAGDDVKLDNQP